MKKTCYAAIDIGSNAVRLLIKSVNEQGAQHLMSKELLLRVPLRLGEDAFTFGAISKDKADNLLRLMKAYKQMMKIYNVADYRACATSAMRDASNAHSIVDKILHKTGINIEIIDGQEESRIVYDNHIEQLFAPGRDYLYVDVGGGSTELNLIRDGKSLNSRSYNIGTVRMLSGMVKNDEWEQFGEDLRKIRLDYNLKTLIGCGGNINKIYRLVDGVDKAHSTMTVSDLQSVYEMLKPITAEQRVRIFKLKPDRADVIVPAAEIFLYVANQIGATEIIVPTIGLADGIIDFLYAKHNSIT